MKGEETARHSLKTVSSDELEEVISVEMGGDFWEVVEAGILMQSPLRPASQTAVLRGLVREEGMWREALCRCSCFSKKQKLLLFFGKRGPHQAPATRRRTLVCPFRLRCYRQALSKGPAIRLLRLSYLVIG